LALEGFLLENEPLAWHFDKPLVVIEHGEMPLPAASDPMAKQSEAVFHILQNSLADRFETWTAARGKDESAITFSVINQSLLPNRSEMSLERAQRLIPQNFGVDKSHLASGRQTFP
jgi:hypothetical protein